MGPLHNRSFCKQTDSAVAKICELETRSRGRDSGCFTLDWNQLRGYAFPPFALIGRCLRQVLQQSVSQLTIEGPGGKRA